MMHFHKELLMGRQAPRSTSAEAAAYLCSDVCIGSNQQVDRSAGP